MGIFGANKFAQLKIGQVILFLLLDITLFGLIATAIWAFLDLIFLTAKPTNKPGNMIFGSMFIILSLSVSMFIGTADLFMDNKNNVSTTQTKEIVLEKNIIQHKANHAEPENVNRIASGLDNLFTK